jgi:hypothetical protein
MPSLRDPRCCRGLKAFVLGLGLLVAGLAAPLMARPVPLGAAEELADRLADGNAHALIIGVSDFDEGGAWRALPGVPVEVAQVAGALTAQGFTVRIARDGGRMTKEEIRREVRSFVQGNGGRPESRLVIYFASHGYREPGEGGHGLLIPSDSKAPDHGDFAASAYSVRELSEDLGTLEARHLFLFVNACFSGAMVPALGPVARGEAAEEGAEVAETAAEWAMRLLTARARLVLTAGSDDQEVPDQGNPFAEAVVGGLAGAADLDGDGLILGSEIAQHVRAQVALKTLAEGRPNDPVFALLPEAGQDLQEGLPGDFVFLSPKGRAQEVARDGEALVKARMSRLPEGQFTDCADCPVMVPLPAPDGGPARLAVARTETTLAEWDACYREFGCRRHLPDFGEGRGDRPAGSVSWQDALEFAGWVDSHRSARCTRYRLPTLAEWQAAAQGARPDLAVCRDCGDAGGLSATAAQRVASLPASPFGLHDVAGNLWEWVVAPDAAACTPEDLRAGGGVCAEAGLVAGGAFSTRASALAQAGAGAAFPRSANRREGRPPLTLPTIGLRLVCDLAGQD